MYLHDSYPAFQYFIWKEATSNPMKRPFSRSTRIRVFGSKSSTMALMAARISAESTSEPQHRGASFSGVLELIDGGASFKELLESSFCRERSTARMVVLFTVATDVSIVQVMVRSYFHAGPKDLRWESYVHDA
jgi:hypothetical protein